MKHLHNIKLKAIRHPYSISITLITNYTTYVWYKSNTSYLLFNQVQRLESKDIIKAFRSVFLLLIETEVQLYSIELQLRLCTLKHVINLHTIHRSDVL